MNTDRCLLLNVLLCTCCLIYIGQASHVVLRISDATPRQTSIVVKEGDPFELICEADSNDNETAIVLKHKGVPVNSSKPGVGLTTTTTLKSDRKHVSVITLKLDHVTPLDHGVYECRLKDDILDQHSKEVTVKVTKTKALQIKTETNSSHAIEVNSNTNSTESRLSLVCDGEFDSNPVWHFNGNRLEDGLSPDQKVMTSINILARRDQGIRQSVLLRQASNPKSLFGRYQCIDANHYLSNSDVLVAGAVTWSTASSLMLALGVIAAISSSIC